MCVGCCTCGRVCVRACVRALCGFACPVLCVRTVVTILAGGASKQRWYDARLTRLGMGIGNPIYRTFFLSPLGTLFRGLSLSPFLPPSLCFSRSLSCGTRANGLLDLRTFLTTIPAAPTFLFALWEYTLSRRKREVRGIYGSVRAQKAFSAISMILDGTFRCQGNRRK